MAGIFFPHTAWKAALTGLFSVLLVFGSCVSSFAVGDIYKYIDENGVIHFTNVPTDSSYQYSLFIKEMTQKPTLTLS
ncbi:MAG: DUF4124 domain-containing protein, partial [Proteobacteria bacterium]|nr:DUF4124 domain-containing protein [Pseudomonadota bacterium]